MIKKIPFGMLANNQHQKIEKNITTDFRYLIFALICKSQETNGKYINIFWHVNKVDCHY
jgi:hypothetical protein